MVSRDRCTVTVQHSLALTIDEEGCLISVVGLLADPGSRVYVHRDDLDVFQAHFFLVKVFSVISASMSLLKMAISAPDDYGNGSDLAVSVPPLSGWPA